MFISYLLLSDSVPGTVDIVVKENISKSEIPRVYILEVGGRGNEQMSK